MSRQVQFSERGRKHEFYEEDRAAKVGRRMLESEKAFFTNVTSEEAKKSLPIRSRWFLEVYHLEY